MLSGIAKQLQRGSASVLAVADAPSDRTVPQRVSFCLIAVTAVDRRAVELNLSQLAQAYGWSQRFVLCWGRTEAYARHFGVSNIDPGRSPRNIARAPDVR